MLKRLFLLAVALVLAAAAAGYLLVQPVRALDLSYSRVSWPDKVKSAFTNLGTVTLTEDELSSILKEQLSRQQPPGVKITGADIDLVDGKLHTYINLQKGPLPIGVHMESTLTYTSHEITLTPVAYSLGQIDVSPDTISSLAGTAGNSFAAPYTIDMRPYLSAELAITDLQIQQGKLKMSVLPARLLK